MSAREQAVGTAMPIAIVGIGCRFPGGVVDAVSFWQMLADGVDAISEIPADRFDIAKYYDETPTTPGKVMSRWGGYIQQRFDEFDAEFFGISRTYAERLDPQQRLLLEASWEALEDAGLDIAALRGTPTGVFVGQWLSDFEHRLFADHSGIDFPMTLGTGRYAVPGRISYAFGFRGPSLSLDAGCSAGLAAVHLAVGSLRRGESTLALAGGVNVILQPHIHVAYSQSRMMAPDGRCKFGDARGDGYVRAEGVGIVVLKPFAQARADGDRVYAVIRGSAVNNDGDSSGSMGTPSRVGQEELLRSAMRDAGVAAADVDYVEAHGTGTRAGDPVELGVLASVLSEGRASGSKVFVGSVKTNIGHTEATAGIAGLIKGALMLQHAQIPPSLHFREPNPGIQWESVPVVVPTTLQAWPPARARRVMGVSSFGIGGTNAHVVLESAPENIAGVMDADGAAATDADAHASSTGLLLPLSARSKPALRALAARYATLLESVDCDAAAVCFSAATRRSALPHRAAFVAADRVALQAMVHDFANGEAATADGTVHDAARRRVAFVVPGQGAQWVGMAREFLAANAAFRDAITACDAAARRVVPWSIIEQLHLDPGAPGYLGDRIDVIQPTLVAIAIAYAAWLRAIGIEPDAVVGHSLGEVGAAAIAGVIDTDSAMRIICRRSALMQRVSGQGAMAVVELSFDDATARLAGHESQVSVAVSNGPRSSVISGEPSAVQAILDGLQRDGIFCRLVNVDVASHSPQMQPLADELSRELAGMQSAAGAVPLYSTVDGGLRDGSEFGAVYWGRNLRQPVQFGRAVERMLEDGLAAFVELGPHPVLTQAVTQTADALDRDAVAVACGRRDTRDMLTATAVIATLWANGAAIDWKRVMPWGRRVVRLPFYPWQRQRFWIEAADLRTGAAPGVAAVPALDPAVRSALYRHDWQPLPSPAVDTSRRARRFIVVASGNAVGATAVAESLQQRGATASVVSSMHDASVTLANASITEDRVDVVVLPADDSALAFSPVQGINDLQWALRVESSTLTPRVWWLTAGAHVVPGQASPEASAQAGALWGAARVIAEEHPAWWGGLVDLVAGADPVAEAPSVAALLAADAIEDQVALRDGAAYALRLLPLPSQPAAPFRWRADAAYLITGGFGGLATHLATAMVADGARRLVLLSRTALPPRTEWSQLDPESPVGARVATIRALEHAGASVHVMCADVADEGAMRSALEAYRGEGWPPIDGVVHAAGVIENRLSGEMTREQFAQVMSAKVSGSEVLDRLFPDVSLFMICSSIMAFWGSAGMANYAAANAGADTVAASRRARGRHAISVQWCVWGETGMVDDAQMRRNVNDMAQAGLRAISVAEGTSLFEFALTRSEAVIAVLPVNWSTFSEARRGRVQPLFSAIPDATARPDAPDGWAQSIAAASGVERRHLLEKLVLTVLSDLLRRPSTQINARQAFGSLGVDSLLALEIRNRLQSALQRPLSATVTWNYNTVSALAAHLGDLTGSQRAASDVSAADVDVPVTVGAPAGDATSLLDAISGLTDDDALRSLRRRR